jgi:hypothetical protein
MSRFGQFIKHRQYLLMSVTDKAIRWPDAH